MVILATHRRTTAARADRIYQIAAGRVVAADGGDLDHVPIREVSNA
jgi:ABC-type transport system involved in cytochrome bd biosynthesis fused ATPase/permease subunit